MRSGTRVVAQFDVIKVIRVTHVGVENGPDYWAVALRLKGALLSVIVGHASDAVDAAIVASRIGTITGKQVRSS